MKSLHLTINIILFVFLLSPITTLANRRHFTYTYESAVLPKASHELEIWNTVRLNRKDFYRGLDTRSEFEFGLGGNFQTSLYLNISSSLAFEQGSMSNEESFGFSNEWKYKVLDANADPIGLAVYGEGSYTNSEIELEGKLIIDKQIDNFLFAFNAVGEHSFVSGIEPTSGISITQPEEVIEFDAGIAYYISSNFTIALEGHQLTKRPPALEGSGSYSAFYLGPTLSIAGPNWWTAFSVMPQVGGSSTNGAGINSSDKLELTHFEKLETRLVLAFEF